MGGFWDEMGDAFVAETPFDAMLQGKEMGGPAFSSLREMVRASREDRSLPLPVEAGTRVRFVANLESVLTYPDVPDPKIAGTVVTVRTGSGDTTYLDGRVFVAWDDGVFRSIAPEHLRAFNSMRQAKNVRMVVSDLGDISSLFTASSSSNDLIHKATKDLWAVRKVGDQYSIERLFDGDGTPLKGV